MYTVRWLKFPVELEGDKLEDLLNKMSQQGFEFVNLYHIVEARQVCVIFKATVVGQMRNAAFRP